MADMTTRAPAPTSSSTDPANSHPNQTVSPDATKIALALTAIFVMCIFGTAYYARRYILHLDPNSAHLRQQNNNLHQRYYYYRRGRGQLQMIELPRGSRVRGGAEGTAASRVKKRKGLAEDKIARFPIVEFRGEDLIPLDGPKHRHDDGAVITTVTNIPHEETPKSPVSGQQEQKSLQQQMPSEAGWGPLLALERFPTISKAIASVRPLTATTKHGAMAVDEEMAQPSNDVSPRISCSVCTDDLVEGVRVRRLPCGHVFHPGCLDPWLMERANTCPLCRLDLDEYLARADSINAEEAEILQKPEAVKLRNDSVP